MLCCLQLLFFLCQTANFYEFNYPDYNVHFLDTYGYPFKTYHCNHIKKKYSRNMSEVESSVKQLCMHMTVFHSINPSATCLLRDTISVTKNQMSLVA